MAWKPDAACWLHVHRRNRVKNYGNDDSRSVEHSIHEPETGNSIEYEATWFSGIRSTALLWRSRVQTFVIVFVVNAEQGHYDGTATTNNHASGDGTAIIIHV